MSAALALGAAMGGFLNAGASDSDPAWSPSYFWMWNDRLDEAKLVSQLEDMRAHGLRSVCIHPFPKDFRPGRFESHMEPDYLTPEYVAVFAKVVKRARELGMDVWLYDEGGWPSGGACGQLAKRDVEGRFRNRRLKPVAGGECELVAEPYGDFCPYPSMTEPGATETFIGMTHEVLARAMPDDIGKTVRFAFMDEPKMVSAVDWGRTSLGWTSDFDAVFRAKKGYDLRPFAKDLLAAGDNVTDDRIAKLRIDYHEVRADLFYERFMLPIRDWCRAHGMISGGHLNGEDVPELTASYGHGDLLRSLRAMDCPGVDVIWRQLFPETPDRVETAKPFPHYASSVLHQNGGTFALSESFGIFGDSCTPDQIKWLVDFQMVRGINRFVFGYYAQSNARQWMLLFEPHCGPVVPYWDYEPQLYRYIARSGAFLSEGRPGAEIAVLYDVRGLWAGGADREAATWSHYAVATALDRMNRDYDFVNDESLARAEVTDDGALKVGAMAYRALVLPTSKWISDGARAKVEAFRKAGGVVTDGADLSRLPTTLKMSGRGAPNLRVMSRRDGARRIYLVVNQGRHPLGVEIDFACKGPVARYDTDLDKLVAVPAKDGKAYWSFAGCGSAIFVTDATPDLPAPKARTRKVMELKDGWTLRPLVSHEAGTDDFVIRPLTEEPVPASLGDWRPTLGETFCGQAVYRVAFMSDRDREVTVDLGDVCWCAGVRLNGADCGKRFFGPFKWDVKLAKGENVLEVTVANLLSTLLGDRAVRARIKAAYPPSTNYEPRHEPADFQNRESGLFGPVRIFE